MVNIRPRINNSDSPFLAFANCPRTLIRTVITVTLIFHSFLSKVQVHVPVFAFLNFNCGLLEHQSLFWIITRCGPLARILWSVCISKSQRIFCVSFSKVDSGKCICHLVTWSTLNFWHLTHAIVSRFKFLFQKFATFAYCVINGFVCLHIICTCCFGAY